ncbi:MAG: HoxN/HupN/NixA family nickel/cobalt transporter [Candidatus Methylomirabilales bacterium]
MARTDGDLRWRFTGSEWTRLAGFFSIIGALHVVGWGLYALYTPRYAAMAGLGALAYTFGLRHAFDADHISAIDDTTRFLLQKGNQPLGVGFFFSLGHSTIVFCMAVAVAITTKAVQTELPVLKGYGALIGTSVSGLFLWFIGILNLLVLLDILKVWQKMKRGRYERQHLEELLMQRGFLNRLFGGRLQRLINHSWQMYPVGLLFGLGFDTASEIALLAITAGVATGEVPFLAVISLPILFAAGMSMMDTADGAFMSKAYRWAFSSPLRKIYYNITTTGLSVAVALIIGTIELLQVLTDKLELKAPVFVALGKLNFEILGYGIVGMFLLTWGFSVFLWKIRRIEERWGGNISGNA